MVTTTQPVEHHQGAAEELPLVWSLAGCGAFSLLKILVSLVTVLVNTAVGHDKSQRQRQARKSVLEGGGREQRVGPLSLGLTCHPRAHVGVRVSDLMEA